MVVELLAAIVATKLKTIHLCQAADDWNPIKLCMIFSLAFHGCPSISWGAVKDLKLSFLFRFLEIFLFAVIQTSIVFVYRRALLNLYCDCS